MSMSRRGPWLILVSIAVVLAGVVRDQLWHAAHDANRQFEDGSTQVRVHWLLWAGVVLLCALVMASPRTGVRHAEVTRNVVLGSGLAYALVSVWHFIEHAQGVDPTLPHVLLIASAVPLVVSGLGLAVLLRADSTSRPTAAERG